MADNPNEVRIRRGDTETLKATVYRNGVIFNLTGSTVWFTAKVNLSDADTAAIIKKNSLSGGISIPSPTNGILLVNILPADTLSLTMPTNLTQNSQEDYVAQLFYDIQVKTPSGEIFTVVRSKMFVQFDITQTTT